MKHLFNLFAIIVLFSTISCISKGNNKPENNECGFEIKNKTVFISVDSCVIFITPTEKDIQEVKSRYEEQDFYTLMDDLSFYEYQAKVYLDDKEIAIYRLDSLKKVSFNNEKIFDLNDNAWDLILYRKGSDPLIVKPIDIKYEFENYFLNGTNSQLIESGKENWVNKSSQVGELEIKDLENKEVLQSMEWFDVADLMKNHPLNKNNVLTYNDAAFYLTECEKYNEARIILLEITEIFPDRVVALLNLADAQWGFDDKEEAKISYKKYIELMQIQNKDLTKIPKRAYDRIE